MIWTTAKSTDVRSRHRPWPNWANGLVGASVALAVAEAPVAAAGVATAGFLDADGRWASGSASDLERRGEVGLEVFEVLQPDRHAEQAGRDARGDELLIRELALRRRWRVDDERVDAAERRGQLREPHRVDDRLTALTPTLDLEGEHPARRAVAELAHGNVMLGMRREARVHHANHAVLTLQPPRECRGVPHVPFHPDAEAQQPAQDEERIERTDRPARVVLERLDAPDEVCATRDHTGDHVTVPAQELGGRLEHQVGTQLERATDIGGRERVVDDVCRTV